VRTLWCYVVLDKAVFCPRPLLLSVSIDDLIRLLKHSGYGTYIGSQFVGIILYADDITLLSGSCGGLQKKCCFVCCGDINITEISLVPTKISLIEVGVSFARMLKRQNF